MPSESKIAFFSYRRVDEGKLKNCLRLLGTFEPKLAEPDAFWYDKSIPVDEPDWRLAIGDRILERPFFILLHVHGAEIRPEVEKECRFALQNERRVIVLYWQEDPEDQVSLPSWLERRQVVVVNSNTLIDKMETLAEFLVSKRRRIPPKGPRYFNLYIASSRSGAGKTLLVAGLNAAVFERRAGYFKPVIGDQQHYSESEFVSDPRSDVQAIKVLFEIPLPLDDLIGINSSAIYDLSTQSDVDVVEELFSRFQVVRENLHHPILIEGVLDFNFLDVSLSRLLDRFEARLVIVLNPGDYRGLAALQYALRELRSDMLPIGLILNHPHKFDSSDAYYIQWQQHYQEIIQDDRIADLGHIAFVPELRGVALNDLCHELGAEFLWPGQELATGDDAVNMEALYHHLVWELGQGTWKDERLIDHYIEHGHPGVIVVTGADRSADVALGLISQTQIGALVLTGHWDQREIIVEVAQKARKPVLFCDKPSALVQRITDDMIRFGAFSQEENLQIVFESVSPFADQCRDFAIRK